jgi:lysophospholipase
MAANAGLKDHVKLLREAGAHLHLSEKSIGKKMQAGEDDKGQDSIWSRAGIDD